MDRMVEKGVGWRSVGAPALVGLWLVGAGFVSALVVRRRRFYREAISGARPVEGWLRAAGERWRRRLGVRRGVEVLVGERRLPPFTAGVFRPVIFLPRALVDRGGRGAVEAALAHEMAHVARLDALWLALQNAVQVVWFFNPLARVAAARLGDARERAVDELVVTRGGMTPRRYASGLVTALSLGLAAPGGPRAAPGLGSPDKRRWTVRIEEILNRRPGAPRPVLPTLACALAALLLLPLAAPAGETPPPPPAPEAPPAAAPPAPPAPASALPPPPAAPVVAPVPPPSVAPAPAPPAPPAPSSVPSPAPAPPPPPAPAVAPAPAPPPPAAPALAHPLPEARVTSGFGERRDPRDGRRRLHEGIDLAAPAGTAVHAPAAGRVTTAAEGYGDGGRFGRTVVLDHGDGLETVYSHLGSMAVAEGDRVEAGEVIGSVGSSGWVTGPHLHLEVRRDGKPVDPAGPIPGLDPLPER